MDNSIKGILQDYIDACECIKETEAEIRRRKGKCAVVHDKVAGSNPEFPYQQQGFSVSGIADEGESWDLRMEERMLAKQKEQAEELGIRISEWMEGIPFRMQRIVRYKFFKNLTWEEIAALMGRRASGESVRKEFERFVKKNEKI